MKFKTLINGSLKKIAIGSTISIVIFSVLILSLSLAKYRSTNSINIAKGTIKYNRPDLRLAEVYVANDVGEYELASEVPESGYVLNEDTTKTRCENKDGSLADITITYENGGLTFSKLVTGGVKCYVYLDVKKTSSNLIPEGNPTDDSMFAGTDGDGIYTWTKGDYSGGNQPIKYFRGNVNNNWVVFGKDGSNYIWWRIIRNNSNGSLRMIYAGTSSSKTSAPTTTGALISNGIFNSSIDNNMYVGFKYTSGQVHGTGTNSIILGTLNTWYDKTLGKSTEYSGKIDLDAGFCNDRQPSTSISSINNEGGTGTTETYYATFNRMARTKVPTLLCNSTQDIFKPPVGLITVDEVNMGGMVMDGGSPNTRTYLYATQKYWTMSPSRYPKALVFYVDGSRINYYIVSSSHGVRPVVNLKADTVFVSGNGESSTPFVVQGT